MDSVTGQTCKCFLRLSQPLTLSSPGSHWEISSGLLLEAAGHSDFLARLRLAPELLVILGVALLLSAVWIFILRRTIRAQFATMREWFHCEASLRRQYRDLFDSANDTILIFTPDDEVILDANRKACETYGFSKVALVGTSLKKLTKDVRRGELEVAELVREGTYKNLETIHFRRDGTEINFLASASLVEYQGRQAVLSLNRDVSDLKRAENEKRLLLHDLQKRFKELSLLCKTVKILQDARRPFSEILSELALLLPSGFQFPEKTTARITIDGVEYHSANSVSGVWSLRAVLATSQGRGGVVEIGHIAGISHQETEKGCHFMAQVILREELVPKKGDSLLLTECKQESWKFHPLGKRGVRGGFEGGVITSDAGGLLLREVEKRTGVIAQFAACFTDHRDGERIGHTVRELVAQRVYGLALWYEDLNDHEQLRGDPLLAVLAEKADPTGA